MKPSFKFIGGFAVAAMLMNLGAPASAPAQPVIRTEVRGESGRPADPTIYVEEVRRDENGVEFRTRLAQADRREGEGKQRRPGDSAPEDPSRPPQPGRPPGPPRAFGGAESGDAFGFERPIGGMAMGMGRGMQRPLIVPAGKLEGSALNEVEEDLQVMARIVDRAVERDREQMGTAMGIFVAGMPGMRQPQNMYVEGFGVIFERNVGFPLTAPQKGEPQKDRKPDNEWERARQEIFGGGRGPNRPENDPFASASPEFDQERVEKLKTQLLESLKNAGNIRHLKADETVAVVVSAPDVGGAYSAHTVRTLPQRPQRVPSGGSTSVQTETSVQTWSSSGSRPGGRPATLTVRVKKSDVDAFAAGKLSLEEFRKKAFINLN